MSDQLPKHPGHLDPKRTRAQGRPTCVCGRELVRAPETAWDRWRHRKD